VAEVAGDAEGSVWAIAAVAIPSARIAMPVRVRPRRKSLNATSDFPLQPKHIRKFGFSFAC
jgi:hypothetical protein